MPERRHRGQQRIGGEVGAPRILDRVRLQVAGIRQHLEPRRHAAQEPLGAQHLLTERMNGRHRKLVAFIERQTQAQQGRVPLRDGECGKAVE